MLNTSQTLKHVTALPEDVDRAKGLKLFHEHKFFIESGAPTVKCEVIDTPSNPAPQLASARNLKGIAPPKSYEVTEKIHTLPAGLWDSNVTSTYEFTNAENGVFIRIKSPMNTFMESLWTIEAKADGSGYELVEDILIKCSRLLMSTVKGSCETQWKKTHQQIIDAMR